MTDLYRENILDHSQHPRNYGLLAEADVLREDVNPSCGDEIKVTLKIDKEKKIVSGIGWEGRGCVISRASMSLLSEKLINMSPDEVMKLAEPDLEELLGFTQPSPGRTKCMMLGLRAVKQALEEFIT